MTAPQTDARPEIADAKIADAGDVDADGPGDPPPVRWRQAVAAVGVAAAADLGLYRAGGYAGAAAFLVGAAAAFAVGGAAFRGGDRVRRGWLAAASVVTGLLAVRLVWLGNDWLVCLGAGAVAAVSLARGGRVPWVLDVGVHLAQSIVAALPGAFGLLDRLFTRGSPVPRPPAGSGPAVGLPAAAVLLFGLPFVFANPDVADWALDRADRAWVWAEANFFSLLPDAAEVALWVAVFLFAAGLLRPLVRRSPLGTLRDEWLAGPAWPPGPAPLYAAWRNTLAAVCVLFAAYLPFEFATLWFREFGDDFYYAGYAHRGAFWLTFALALATGTLTVLFRGRTLADPRLPTLKRLAWVWTALNALLVAAAVNRLLIYVGYNGLTRLRVVGLLGVAAVAGGFGWVVVKIARERDFLWLVRRDLLTVAAAGLLFALLPVDRLVHAHNVGRVLAGDPRPAVQLLAQPLDAGGALSVVPLLDSGDPVLREGAAALLARADLRLRVWEERERGWGHTQLAEAKLRAELDRTAAAWRPLRDPVRRRAALGRFRAAVWRWY